MPSARRSSATRLVVWLFPEPVRTAQMATTGFDEVSIVSCGDSSRKLAPAASAQDVPAEYQQVLTTLGKQGDYKANVLKVNIPRNDVSVTVANVKTPTPFGFGGWVAMEKGTGGMDVLMGDLVLTENEVNPVMSALLNGGFDVTALHNHFFKETPRIFYMHVHGHGDAASQVQHERLSVLAAALAQPEGRNQA